MTELHPVRYALIYNKKSDELLIKTETPLTSPYYIKGEHLEGFLHWLQTFDTEVFETEINMLTLFEAVHIKMRFIIHFNPDNTLTIIFSNLIETWEPWLEDLIKNLQKIVTYRQLLMEGASVQEAALKLKLPTLKSLEPFYNFQTLWGRKDNKEPL